MRKLLHAVALIPVGIVFAPFALMIFAVLAFVAILPMVVAAFSVIVSAVVAIVALPFGGLKVRITRQEARHD